MIMDLLTGLLVILATALSLFYFWLKRQNTYWERTNIPYIPSNVLFGNLREIFLFKKSAADGFQELYNHEIGKNEPVVGINFFHRPMLLIRNLDVVKRILVKDFHKFSNRFTSADSHGDRLGHYNIFLAKNPIWKELRINITPIFTTGKIKQIFKLVDDVGHQLSDHLLSFPLKEKQNCGEFEMKDICALYTTDVIASVAYGIHANSFKHPNSDFRRNGKKVFDFTYARGFEFNILFYLPDFVSWLKCKVFSKDTTKFLRSTMDYVMTEREKSGVARNDLIDLLLTLKTSAKNVNEEGKEKFENDMLVAQAAIFFTAGFETTSSTMSFGLYELSKNIEVQTKLRKEIKETLAKNNDELSYDIIHNMPYLTMVIHEILRLYPPLPFLDRECTLPANEKGYSLEPENNYIVPNGMPVNIPIYAIQRDPQYFPEPDKFDPERFSPENKDNIVPYSYLPFGTGPHNCIGERFGLIQVKIGLINFLKNHYVEPSPKTHKVMILEKKALMLQAEGGIYCKIMRDPL